MATTISGQTFANSDVVAGQKFYAANYLALIAQMQALNDELVSECVSLGGTQTISGVKTFSAFPLTPSSAPTANYQTANKKYVDDQIDATVGSGTISPTSAASGTVSLTLPNGIIMKWGEATSLSTTESVSFSTAFPTACYNVQVSISENGSTPYAPMVYSVSKTGFTVEQSASQNCYWFAVGY